jgi:hypothetical protein
MSVVSVVLAAGLERLSGVADDLPGRFQLNNAA